MPLTLKPFVIIRRLIDSNSVNICHDYNALWGDYKKIKDKWRKIFTKMQRENSKLMPQKHLMDDCNSYCHLKIII